MATPGATQALLGAFFFGILFNAASAALVLYVIGHGSTIFRDGLRLVLICFLLSSAAWALVEFIATIIEPTATSSCQVAAVFSSVFDQLGRIFVEQYLIWATQVQGKKSVLTLVSQILLVGRFGVGMAFIGLTGSEFNPTCVPVSKIFPIGVTVVALDAVILVLLAIQVLSSGSTKGITGDGRAPKRSVTLVIIGLAIWIGMSVVLLLGMRGIELVLKTTLPALGLAILVALVTVLSGTLVVPRGPPPRRPDSPTSRDIGGDRDLSSSDSSDYPPSRYEDVKGITVTTAMAAYASPNDGAMPGISSPFIQISGVDQANTKKKMRGDVWAKATAGKLMISKPVLMDQEGTVNPLDKIATIDLATAASNEKERRIRLAQRGSTLIAQRPAPPPPNSSGQNGILSREISTKRKQVAPSSLASLERSVSSKTTKTTTGLSVEANASSTSSELSPGTEKMRRRSPRQPDAPLVPTTFQPIRPGDPIRIPIPRSRTPPESPKPAQPPKTPLQRRKTTGLPSNPRAQAMASRAKEAKNQRQETVMFVNNIVYDDPNAVNNIVQGASKTPMTSQDSGNSVVNRPRPIPRKGDNDRHVFPAEFSPSQEHRRSKSAGSIASRKSILQSMPGSPTQLPPLPPPPKSAGNAPRPLPNDTMSMTFDEKMNFLYTAPLSAPSTADTPDNRRSLVPQVPPLPATYMINAQRTNIESTPKPEAEANSEKRMSKITDRSSIRTTSILGIEDIPQQLARKISNSRKAADELGQSWLPGISVENERQKRRSRDTMNRLSSPVIPEASHFSVSSMRSEQRTRDDYASTIWGSVYSPVLAVEIQQARLNARSTYIKKDSRSSDQSPEPSVPSDVPSEVIEVMLDTSVAAPAENEEFIETAMPEVPVFNFHHRVGEECPTFSTRKEKGRLRKMPPPAPLILSVKTSKRAIVIQPAEPSPMESPEAAYQMIQAQLHRFEEPNRESVASQGGRLALLENLEREMGQLENRWQGRLGHDSVSSIQTSPSKDSRPPSLAAEHRASRRVSVLNSATRTKVEDSTDTPSSRSPGTSSENAPASLWQTRLAEAQLEYMKSTPDLLMKRNNLNFLSVSKAALGSASPPDTDESDYESGTPGSIQPLVPIVFQPVVQVHELWKPLPPAKSPVNEGLWIGATQKSCTEGQVHELPGLSVRPAIRKASGSLAIESTRLWEKPTKSSRNRAMSGLWRKYDPSRDSTSSSMAIRPVTMRPPRRNKRVTLLPDILENPEPLPDNRGTLGLFQFPWGEKSDHASIQPRPIRMYTAMPGTMTTGGPSINASLEARSKQLEAEELTTSFFDDYEAEEEGDNFAYSDSDGEGDDFDETTLWEIASLLKSKSVPSKNSLLPPPLPTSDSVNSPVSAENIREMEADDYRDDGLVLEEPIPVDRSSLIASEPVKNQSLLWDQSEALDIRIVGLPQPDSATWKSYITEPSRTVRSKLHIEDIAPIQSNKLWELGTNNHNASGTGLLWSLSKPFNDVSVISETKKAVEPTKTPSLWVQPMLKIDSNIVGLFDTGHFRADYRRTSKQPAAFVMTRKPRAVEIPLAKLTSKTLWTGKVTTKATLMWEQPMVIYTPERDGLFDSNESRPNFRRTTKEPAAISVKRVFRKPEGPLASLNTSSLWSREILVSSRPNNGWLFASKKSNVLASRSAKTQATPKVQVIPLWEKLETSPEPEQEGLFDVSIPRNNYRKTFKAPAAISMPTKPRTNREPLPTIDTTNLWTGEPFEPQPTVSAPEPLLETEPAPESTVGKSLWEQPMSLVPSSNIEGLFDANTARADYRRTSKLPVAIDMARTPRKVVEPLATLTSTKLWETQPESSYPFISNTVSLWNTPTMSLSVMPGLFQLDPSRKTYRTTLADPAALHMDRKPRVANLPVPSLESSRLWSGSQITSVELDWITISSVAPKSPSVAYVSTASSPPSSPVTDSSSIKTNTTKASSTKGFFNGWFGKKKKEPEVPQVPEDSTLEVAREIPAVLELPREFVVKNLDEAPHKKPVHTPLRQLHRQNIAYRANWDDELREAIKATYPGTMTALRASYPQDWEMELEAAIKASYIPTTLTRGPASPRDWSCALHKAIVASYPEIRFSRGQAPPAQWNAALQEAITSSYPPQPNDFDVAVRHPAFMGSMETTAETVHPAVCPTVLKRRGSYKEQNKSHSDQPTSFDAAVRHPVFFGSMETTAEIVHPAIDSGMLKRNVTHNAISAPLLWAKPTSTKATITGGMWVSNGSAPKAQTSSSPVVEVSAARRNLRESKQVAGSPVKPDFTKQGMWRRNHISEESQPRNRDWLEDSMKKRFSRVELRY
ncbi:hypothetical protein F4804DRAFT_56886 [Jackrogersella minutella]|nr:hypothetical protein F4804DRAFT_56886 [Jackrogersella minutella]